MSLEKWRFRIFEKKICWPKNGPFRAKKGPKWGFRSSSCSKCIKHMAKSSSAPPQKTAKSLSFFLTLFQKLLTLISEILSKFSFDWYITCWGFFQRNISKNLLEGAKKGCFRAIFSGDISNTSKTKVYFWHKSIPGGLKTSLGFLTMSKWSSKSKSPVKTGPNYITGDQYVTKTTL